MTFHRKGATKGLLYMTKTLTFEDKLRTNYVVQVTEAPVGFDLNIHYSLWLKVMVGYAAEVFNFDAEIETLKTHGWNKDNSHYVVLEVPVSSNKLQVFCNEYRWRREQLIRSIC